MKLIFIDKDTLWCGTEASLETALLLQARLFGSDIQALSTSDDEDTPPPAYENVDGVAVIPVKGALVNADLPDWLTAALGVTTYPQLQRAFAAAAADDAVGSVLLDVSSPGGSVAGISDTNDALSALREVKPVTTFAGDLMASAGYWLGSNADHIISGNMSTVGSIGVIGTHVEVSKYMEKLGITPTVLRAGEFKALASQYEPLTDKAKAQMQARLDAVYEQFVQTVATNRGVPFDVAKSNMAEGREFFGDAALRAGLVDEIGKFPRALAFAAQKVDNGNRYRNNTLSAQTEELDMSGTTQLTTPAAQPAAAGAAPAPVVPEAAAAAPAAAAQPAQPQGELVAYLTSKINDQEQQLREAATAATAAQAQLAVMPGLRAIAEASLNQMRVALGHSATDAATMSAESLLAEHTRVSAEYGAKFPVGGIAAGTADTEPGNSAEATAAAADPLHLARVRATQLN